MSGELNESFSADQITVENSFDNISGVGTVESNTGLGSFTLSENQSIPAIGLQGLFGTVVSEAESDASGDVIHASATIVSGDADANVTVQTLDSWPNGAYQYVHVAVGNETGTLNSDTGTVAVSPGGGLITVVARATVAVPRTTLADRVMLGTTTKRTESN